MLLTGRGDEADGGLMSARGTKSISPLSSAFPTTTGDSDGDTPHSPTAGTPTDAYTFIASLRRLRAEVATTAPQNPSRPLDRSTLSHRTPDTTNSSTQA